MSQQTLEVKVDTKEFQKELEKYQIGLALLEKLAENIRDGNLLIVNSGTGKDRVIKVWDQVQEFLGWRIKKKNVE